MSLDKIKWDMFLEDIDFWERTYNLLAGKLLEKHGLMAVLALKDHIEAGFAHFNSVYGEREKEHFQEAIENLKEVYDPDIEIEKLKETLLCVELDPFSHLVKELGTDKICGKYLEMDVAECTTKIMDKESGEFQEKTSNLTINLGYPSATEITKITFHDIKSLEAFEE